MHLGFALGLTWREARRLVCRSAISAAAIERLQGRDAGGAERAREWRSLERAC